MRRAVIFPALGAALACCTGVNAAAAQTCWPVDGPPRRCELTPAATEANISTELVVLGLNAALGGLTAGVRQRDGEGSFLAAFWRGAVGGAGTYAGKRMVVSDFSGSGALGRAVAAAGASVTRNAADGSPMFHRLTVPVAFMRLHWRPAHKDLRASVDVPGVAAIAGIYLSNLGPAVDLHRTFASGAPVFMARDWERERGWHGRHVFGAILLRGDQPDISDPDSEPQLLERALHHERIHVLQYDQAFILWNEPYERAVMGAVGAPQWLRRHFDLSLSPVTVTGLTPFLPRWMQVWETEAHAMARTGLDGNAH